LLQPIAIGGCRHGKLELRNQVDWLLLEKGSVQPTQGRTLAVMEVPGGYRSFNAVNTLRLVGRWMRMVTILNQSRMPRGPTSSLTKKVDET
jgi:arsenic resistance protein ArsH